MVDNPEQPDRLAALNANNAVLIGVGGRNTKYGIRKRHTRNRKSMFRFTRNQRNNTICRVKRYRAIRRRARTEIVNINEEHLSASPNKNTTNPFLFRVYLLR